MSTVNTQGASSTTPEVKPIFVIPQTSPGVKPGDWFTFKVTLERAVPEPDGDNYDITPVQSYPESNPALVAYCPATINVPKGDETFDLAVQAALDQGCGTVQLMIRERVLGGSVIATLVVAS